MASEVAEALVCKTTSPACSAGGWARPLDSASSEPTRNDWARIGVSSVGLIPLHRMRRFLISAVCLAATAVWAGDDEVTEASQCNDTFADCKESCTIDFGAT